MRVGRVFGGVSAVAPDVSPRFGRRSSLASRSCFRAVRRRSVFRLLRGVR